MVQNHDAIGVVCIKRLVPRYRGRAARGREGHGVEAVADRHQPRAGGARATAHSEVRHQLAEVADGPTQLGKVKRSGSLKRITLSSGGREPCIQPIFCGSDARADKFGEMSAIAAPSSVKMAHAFAPILQRRAVALDQPADRLKMKIRALIDVEDSSGIAEPA